MAGLRAQGIDAPVLVVTSNGGANGIDTAAEQPVFFIGSGPAAGVVGAARLARAIAAPNAIAFDMGGTTAKAALIEDGVFVRTQEYEFRAGISTSSRFIKAGGYLLKVPAIDIAEVGAGAGSIATVDDGGLLHVGPLVGRRRAWSCMLWPRRRARHGDRCQCGPGPAQSRPAWWAAP